MKKFLQGFGIVVLLVGGAAYLGREPLWDIAKDTITNDMFVAADTDEFDPGLSIGEKFPDIQASYKGEVLTDMGQFLADKGMLFIANRSVDW